MTPIIASKKFIKNWGVLNWGNDRTSYEKITKGLGKAGRKPKAEGQVLI